MAWAYGLFSRLVEESEMMEHFSVSFMYTHHVSNFGTQVPPMIWNLSVNRERNFSL
jgi:hypothetical protein